jgi:hypothetical protein
LRKKRRKKLTACDEWCCLARSLTWTDQGLASWLSLHLSFFICCWIPIGWIQISLSWKVSRMNAFYADKMWGWWVNHTYLSPARGRGGQAHSLTGCHTLWTRPQFQKRAKTACKRLLANNYCTRTNVINVAGGHMKIVCI